MYDFLVGGYLPGTNIQISLQGWLVITSVILCLAYYVWTKHRPHFQLFAAKNAPLPASELHYRIKY